MFTLKNNKSRMEQGTNRLLFPHDRSLSSPTPSNSSRLTQQWPESMSSIAETTSEASHYLPSETFAGSTFPTFEPIREKPSRRYADDDDDDDLLVTSGDLENAGDTVGLFDVVKREFRCKTAVITNKPAYEDPKISLSPRKPKVNFIQVGQKFTCLVNFIINHQPGRVVCRVEP